MFGVIVKKPLVPEEAYTGRKQTMVMVDCTSRVLPEEKVNIDTPYYKGEVLTLRLENRLVDLIVGNIPGARERADQDIKDLERSLQQIALTTTSKFNF